MSPYVLAIRYCDGLWDKRKNNYVFQNLVGVLGGLKGPGWWRDVWGGLWRIAAMHHAHQSVAKNIELCALWSFHGYIIPEGVCSRDHLGGKHCNALWLKACRWLAFPDSVRAKLCRENWAQWVYYIWVIIVNWKHIYETQLARRMCVTWTDLDGGSCQLLHTANVFLVFRRTRISWKHDYFSVPSYRYHVNATEPTKTIKTHYKPTEHH